MPPLLYADTSLYSLYNSFALHSLDDSPGFQAQSAPDRRRKLLIVMRDDDQSLLRLEAMVDVAATALDGHVRLSLEGLVKDQQRRLLDHGSQEEHEGLVCGGQVSKGRTQHRRRQDVRVVEVNEQLVEPRLLLRLDAAVAGRVSTVTLISSAYV